MSVSGWAAARVRALRIGALAVLALTFSTEALAGDQTIAIQSFSSQGGYGTQVTPNLPVYRVHVGKTLKLVDDSGVVFASYEPQSTTPITGSDCVIPNLYWAAYYTTFYVVLENDPDHMLLVQSCGKSPLQLNSSKQYPDISQNNFINHAQIAGMTNGVVNKVIAAGEIDIIDGRIVYMDTCSGHFKPSVGSFLAYASKLDKAGVLPLTSTLKSIIKKGAISQDQISDNLTYMGNSSSITPQRNVRSGTGGCYSYTTVFLYSTKNGQTILADGLLAVDHGTIQVFQTDINEITGGNVKSIYLGYNTGFYDFSAHVDMVWLLVNTPMVFEFTDETSAKYKLSIHVASYNHVVDYDSKKPNINKIVFDWEPPK